jgi:heme o synthase
MEIITPADPSSVSSAGRLREKFSAYLELTKPRITVLVVISALAGFTLGAGSSIPWIQLLHTGIGIALLSSGIATLNQYLERDLDALMQRTRLRPLPMGRLSPAGAFWFGIAISLIALFYLAWLVNPLTAAWGLVALATYLFLYTPLKTRSRWCTFIGAFPGALPPLLGWTAARNEMGFEALVLFGIMFLWQFPHFHAIANIYRDDYARAGVLMLPVIEPDGRSTARQIVVASLALIPVSLLPTFLNFSGRIYLISALILGAGFLFQSVKTAGKMTREQSTLLLKASVIYLPILFTLMVLDR